MEFWSENLQESIQAAGQQAKTLLCFVRDDTEASDLWEATISSKEFDPDLRQSTIRLRLRRDSQEFGFLNGVCPVQHVPALVWIKGGQIEEKLESNDVSVNELKEKLATRYKSTTLQERPAAAEPGTTRGEQCLNFEPSAGRMRLPNNAYDSLRERTEMLQKQKISPKNILQVQLRLLDNIAALKDCVRDIKSRPNGATPVLPDDAINRLLNTPASALQARQAPSPSTSAAASRPLTPATGLTPTSSTAPSPPPEPAEPPSSSTPQRSSNPSQAQQAQRANYIRQQREREAAQRGERERIKAQIKFDREERRRLDEIRKQSELATLRQQNSTTASPSSTDIRIQVRTLDGSTLRNSFAHTATITNDVRPWIDSANPDASKLPYNLKLILTPSSNRNIEASEEGQELPNLGIVGSATLIMVPVKAFVDSYTGSSSGVAGSIVGGLMGAGGSVVNGVLGMFGWGSPSTPTEQAQSAQARNPTTGAGESASAGSSTSGSQVKVRTLADQRAEENRKRGNQLYNGNSLDFQGRKDDDSGTSSSRKQD